MDGLSSFHAIAAGRGDGLLPELRALLESRAAGPNVVEMKQIRTAVAGPAPVTSLPEVLPANVVLFRSRTGRANTKNLQTEADTSDLTG